MISRKKLQDVEYCELILGIPFEGDKNCLADVNYFLDTYLQEARKEERTLSKEYLEGWC